MSFNLRHRSFLKELDFTPAEWKFLLTLAADLKRAKYVGTESPRLRGKNIALIFEKTSTRTRCAFEVAAHDQGAARHLPRPDRLAARPQGVGQGHRARARAASTTASSTAASPRTIVETLGRATPACRSGTASPTSGTRPRPCATC